MRDPELSVTARRFLEVARRGVLSTTTADGRSRLVPVCHVVLDADGHTMVYTPIDDKPKQTREPRELARVRDILARPAVTLLVDRWDEDWSSLAWLRVEGRASLVEPADDRHAPAVEALRAKYPQYATQRLEERPLIRIELERIVSWGDLAG